MFFRFSRHVLPVQPACSSGSAGLFFQFSRHVLPVEPACSSG
jgi:hypothetical protein